METADWNTAVLCDWRVLEVAPWELRSNRNVVLEVVRSNGLALQYASDALRCDPNVALEAVIRTGAALLHCHDDLQKDVDFVLEAVKGNPHVLDYCTHLLGNHGFMLKAVQMNWKAIELAVESLRGDAEIVFAAAKTNVQSLAFASEELLDDHDFMHSIVKLTWKAVAYSSENVRGAQDVVLSGVRQNWLALPSASEPLQKDRDFMIQAMQANRDAIPYGVKLFHGDRLFWILLVRGFPDGVGLFVEHYGEGELTKDAELMHELTKKDWRAFQIASPELRSENSLQLLAVCQCWEAVKWAHKVNLPVMTECVRQEWQAIELFLDPNGPCEDGHITHEERVVLANSNPHIVRAAQLADDDVTVLAAVTNEGPVLRYASERIRADRDIATTAIRQNWRALEFASKRLRGDKKLVMETLKQCGLSLQFATDKLRCDHSVVLEGITRHRQALPFIHEQLYTDEVFWCKVCRRFSDGWRMAAKFGMKDLAFLGLGDLGTFARSNMNADK